jgi:hypothetical protein
MDVAIYLLPVVVVFLIFLGLAKNCQARGEDERQRR